MLAHAHPSPDRRQLLLLAGAALAGGAAAQMPPAASNLAVGFVAYFEPFVMGNKGILVELTQEALRRLGYTMRTLEFPSLRLDGDPLTEFPAMQMFVGTPATHRPDYHYAPLYAYDNVAATLTENKLRIDSLDDLKGKSIITFNNADVHLKEPFTSFHRQFLKGNKLYLETERVESIMDILINRRAQVVLIDRTLLRYHARRLGRPNLAGITLHELFTDKNVVYAVSKNGMLIEAMRRQLEQMERSGWTAGMLSRYL